MPLFPLAEMLAARGNPEPSGATPIPEADQQAATLAQYLQNQQQTPNATAANAPTYAPGSDVSSSFINATTPQLPPPMRTPVKNEISSKVMGLLHDFSGGAGEALMHFAGVQTPLQRMKAINDINESQIRQQEGQMRVEQMGQMVTLPNGMSMPLPLATKLFPSLIAAQSREKVADKNIQSKFDLEGMKLAISQGKVSRIVPEMQNGEIVMTAYNAYNQPIGSLPKALPPASYLPKTSSTVEFKQMDDGSYVALPKSTTSAPRLPGGGFGAPRVANGKVALPVIGADGQPLKGLNSTTSATRTMGEAAPKVEAFADRIDKLIDSQASSLGPAAGRWNEFMTGKVGAPNEEFTKLRTDVGLLQTLLMRMHVGARGGEYIMKHFQDLIDSGKQSPENLKAAIGEIRQYARDLQMHGGAAQPPKASPPAGATHIAPGSDGKRHYTNAQGQDLGVAP